MISIRHPAIVTALMMTPITAIASPPVCFEFDGSLPFGATLTRATPRTDATGALIPANSPRFSDGAIAPAPQLITGLYDTERVVCTGEVDGQGYVGLIRGLLDVRIVVGDPLCGEEGVELAPHPTVRAKFGFNSAEWGVPRTIEIFPNSTVLLHCYEAGPQRRCITVRTTLDDFVSPSGWTLVRTSHYVPPPGKESAYPTAAFTRTTHLPNLGVTVSTIAEYTPLGLVSTVDPSDGRSLGYASTDSGMTWTRVIDTDDPALGRTLVDGAKHMHHLEPFEWFDETSQQWKIGAVGCLGDSEGESGQIWVRSPTAAFPPEGQNHLMTLSRTRIVGRRALTDIFPINNAESAGAPLRFIHGQDGELGGIIEARVENGVEENIAHFIPTVPNVRAPVNGVLELPQYPFVFQMDRLTGGGILAATTEAWAPANPNGFWQSDASSTRWATVRLADTRGYTGVMRSMANRFWTVAILGLDRPFTYISQLWQAGIVTPRTPVVVGAAAHSTVDMPIFDAVGASGTLIDATGTIPPPPELPAGTTIQRLTIPSLPVNTQFSSATVPVVGAAPGDHVHIVFWARPAPVQAGCQAFQLPYRFQTQSAGVVQGPRLLVDHETNVWTRIGIVATVPPEGMTSFTIDAQVYQGDATPQKPIDFYLTRPTLFVSSQPIRQHVPAGGVAEDRLSVALPGLGSDWTIGILATEAMTFAVSAVGGSGGPIGIVQGVTGGQAEWSGMDTTLELRSGGVALPVVHGASTPQDVFVPTQTLVFLRRDSVADRIDMWVSRGMGDFDVVQAPGMTSTPTELRFGTPDWSTVFEGEVHRVRVWTDRALTEQEMRRERLTLPSSCEDAPQFDVSEPIYVCPPLPPKPCKGDINNDGFTNALDFNIIALNFGLGPDLAREQGDLSGDGYVNASDFNILAGDFGCVFPGE